MVVRVWEQGVKKKKGVVYVRLQNWHDDEVMVNVVDSEGEHQAGGYLVEINGDGLRLQSGVGEEFGFPLGCQKQLLVKVQ